MREIKFRAWCPKCGRFETIPLWEKESLSKEDDFSVWMDNLVIEQYTGLKDKNGREIYEGDIVNISDAPAVRGKALVVKFDEFLIGEYSCNKMTGWMVQVINGEWAASLADEVSRCEVIGNIHENPELLGGEE